MSDRNAVRDRIIQTIRTVQPALAEVNITEETSLSDLQVDSLHLIEVGVLLEDNFGAGVRFDEWLEQERAKSTNAYSMASLVSFVSEAATA